MALHVKKKKRPFSSLPSCFQLIISSKYMDVCYHIRPNPLEICKCQLIFFLTFLPMGCTSHLLAVLLVCNWKVKKSVKSLRDNYKKVLGNKCLCFQLFGEGSIL